jgi:carboxyl-terminal processing protease
MKLWLTAAAAMVSAGAAEPDYPAMIHSLGKTVADNFYDPHMRGVDWARRTRDYASRASSVRDDAAFRRLATEMMSALNASHTDISPPAASIPQTRPRYRA